MRPSQEAIELILAEADKESPDAKKELLKTSNHAGIKAYDEDDQKICFELHEDELRSIFEDKLSTGTLVEGTLRDVLVQLAVHLKWKNTCEKIRRREAFFFISVLAVYLLSMLWQAGVHNNQANLQRGFESSIGRLIEEYSVKGSSDALSMFTNFTVGIGSSESDAPLSARSAGRLIGQPVIVHWRDERSATAQREYATTSLLCPYIFDSATTALPYACSALMNASALNDLDGWVDYNSTALGLDVTFASDEHFTLTHLQLLSEFPRSSGIFISSVVRTYRIPVFQLQGVSPIQPFKLVCGILSYSSFVAPRLICRRRHTAFLKS